MVIRERASGKELDGFPLKAFQDDVCNYVCNGSDVDDDGGERASGMELDNFPLQAFHDDVCDDVCDGSYGVVDHDDDDG